MNIVLAGMPGCGKTTVGTVLSHILGRRFIDTDAVITQKHGDISAIFDRFGEEYFRGLECAAVKEAASMESVVISTGGGCLANGKNVAELRKSGKIIYLKTGISELLRRLSGDTTRPLLRGDAEKNLNDLYARRAKTYESAADFTVCTDGLPPERVAEKILELIK